MPNLKFLLLKLLISWNIWAMKLIYPGEGGGYIELSYIL